MLRRAEPMDPRSKVGSRDSLPPARKGADGLREDLMTARHELLASRHPVYHRLLGFVISMLSGSDADGTLLAGFERCFRTRSFPTFYERPLLLLAALRADALEEGAGHPLYAALAVPTPELEAVTLESVTAALGRERVGLWSRLTNRRVQTNDPSRAIAWLWPAFLAGCDGGKRPLALVDVGASAGLNLVADELPAAWTDLATGKAILCATRVAHLARVGYDLRPLNVKNDDDVLWMRACIWPGDVERLARFEAAVKAMRAASSGPSPPTLERLTASLVPERLAALANRSPDGGLLLAFQTLLSGYLEVNERESYRNGMLELLERLPAGSALWTELELDDGRRRLPAVLIAHVRAGSGVKSLRLARMSQHPTGLEVDTAGVAELRRCLE